MSIVLFLEVWKRFYKIIRKWYFNVKTRPEIWKILGLFLEFLWLNFNPLSHLQVRWVLLIFVYQIWARLPWARRIIKKICYFLKQMAVLGPEIFVNCRKLVTILSERARKWAKSIGVTLFGFLLLKGDSIRVGASKMASVQKKCENPEGPKIFKKSFWTVNDFE